MLRLPSLAAVWTACLALSAPALAEDLFRCITDDPQGAGNWIAPEIFIAHDRETGAVVIGDAVIETFAKGPVNGKVSTDNKVRTTFTWTLATSAGTQKASMIYRLTIQKADLSARIIAIPRAMETPFRPGRSARGLKADAGRGKARADAMRA